MKVAAIGDLHVTEDSVAPYRDMFAEISRTADVLLLCGDLTNFGKSSEAEILAEDLRVCDIPVLGVLGNHDYECGQPEEVARILHEAGMTVLDDQAVEIDGVGFAGVKGFMGGYGIVGGNLPLAAGMALSSDYRGTEEVTLCVFGDGASNQGTFGETLNLAALWRLPVVFMVTNNQFGMGTALERHSAVTDLHRRGEGFGVPGMRCDGMDVLDTHAVIGEALKQATSGRG